MPVVTCARCQNRSFELREAKINGASQQLAFVHAEPRSTLSTAMLCGTSGERDLRIKNLEDQLAAAGNGVAHISRIVGALANQRAI